MKKQNAKFKKKNNARIERKNPTKKSKMDLISTPLLMSFVAGISTTIGEFPKRRFEIFETLFRSIKFNLFQSIFISFNQMQSISLNFH